MLGSMKEMIMKSVMNELRTFVRDEEGVTAIEYGLIAALIALAIVIGAGALGTSLNNMFQAIADFLDGKQPTLP